VATRPGDAEEEIPAGGVHRFKDNGVLAQHVAAADVFVFPSRTDTFGLVVIEALASGVPVAAYPVQGPVDIIENGVTGFLDEDLQNAAMAALALKPEVCRTAALAYTWRPAPAVHRASQPGRNPGRARLHRDSADIPLPLARHLDISLERSGFTNQQHARHPDEACNSLVNGEQQDGYSNRCRHPTC